MEHDKQLEPPKFDIRDRIYYISKAVLGSIPGYGGAAAAALEMIVGPLLEKRKREWFEHVADSIQELREKYAQFSIENLANDPAFLSTLMHASLIALRSHQERKLEALRNGVLNTALPHKPEDDLQLIFLQHVDAFTDWHLIILSFLSDPKKVMTEAGTIGKVHKDDAALISYLYMTYPQLDQKHDLVKYIVGDLVNRGLINDYYVNRRTNPNTFFAGCSTPLGKEFMKFVNDPLSTNEPAP